MNKEDVENVVMLSKETGRTEKEIMLETYPHFKYNSLYHFKKKFNIPILTPRKSFSRKRKYNVNDDFFESPSLLNSYWAGFIAADGNLSGNYRKLNIGLAKKDKCILEQFLKDIGAENKIWNVRVPPSPIYHKWADSVRIQITS